MENNCKTGRSVLTMVDNVFWFIDTAIYLCMIGIVLLQIFARVFLPRVPAWTEEMSRYLQIYLVAFGAGLAIKHEAFVSVETIFGFISKKAGIVLKILQNIIVFVLFAFFFWYSIDLYKLGIPRSAVTMPFITMNVIYFSMILMSASALFYIVRAEYLLIKELRMEVRR